ncbi:MAG: TIGR03905 family TSCPD domain-containing protein [Lachnospiraceae bacterium]|nr:TIGR03905 family TSCPD domain-containing protein [Lachnospiraceae bacterium]
MHYSYKTKNTCATNIEFDLEDDIVHNVVFTGGCNGNLKAIQKLVDGFSVDEINEALGGNICGMRPTSCTDQLAQAVREASLSAKAK